MFDIGFSELLLIGVVALLVLGPERLPRAARMAGLWMRRLRASWYSVRADLERELADEDLRRSLQQNAQVLREAESELRQGVQGMLSEGRDAAQTLASEVKGAAVLATANAAAPMPAADGAGSKPSSAAEPPSP